MLRTGLGPGRFSIHLLDSSGSPKVEIFFPFSPSGFAGLDCGSRGGGQS